MHTNITCSFTHVGINVQKDHNNNNDAGTGSHDDKDDKDGEQDLGRSGYLYWRGTHSAISSMLAEVEGHFGWRTLRLLLHAIHSGSSIICTTL